MSASPDVTALASPTVAEPRSAAPVAAGAAGPLVASALTPAHVRALQRSAGNQCVARLLAGAQLRRQDHHAAGARSATPTGGTIQVPAQTAFPRGIGLLPSPPRLALRDPTAARPRPTDRDGRPLGWFAAGDPGATGDHPVHQGAWDLSLGTSHNFFTLGTPPPTAGMPHPSAAEGRTLTPAAGDLSGTLAWTLLVSGRNWSLVVERDAHGEWHVVHEVAVQASVVLQGSTAAGTPAPDGSTPILTGAVGGEALSLQADLLERQFSEFFDWHAVVAAIAVQEGWDATLAGSVSATWQAGTTFEYRPAPFTPGWNRLSIVAGPVIGGTIAGPGNLFTAGGTISVNFNADGFDAPTPPAHAGRH